MDRIMIVGQPGSGKSTLARAVGAGLGLPVVHVDQIHWMDGWQERPMAERIDLALAKEAQERWVFEGGLSRTWENRLARADMLVWVDRGVWLRFWRVVMRTLRQYGRTRADLPEGCPERFDAGTWEFWVYIWRTRRSARDKVARLAMGAREAGKPVVHLRSDRAARAWLREMGCPVPPEWGRAG